MCNLVGLYTKSKHGCEFISFVPYKDEVCFEIQRTVEAYGFAILDKNNQILIHEEFQAAPFIIPPGGGSIKIDMNIMLDAIVEEFYLADKTDAEWCEDK